MKITFEHLRHGRKLKPIRKIDHQAQSKLLLIKPVDVSVLW